MSVTPRLSVLFVCMGNICRSPTAEAVFRHKVSEAGLVDAIEIDSAGTHAYHVGHPPDSRSEKVAARNGIAMKGQRARKVNEEDFRRFQHIIAMDKANMASLEKCRPEDATAALSLMLAHAPSTPFVEVPDPYYGGARGFDQVFDLVSLAADGLIETLRRDLKRTQ